MNSIPMAVVVFERPKGVEPSSLDQKAADVLHRHLADKPLEIMYPTVASVDSDMMAKLRQALDLQILRSATHEILRALGKDGEILIERELAFHFVWDGEPDSEFGTVQILYVVPDAVVALSAALHSARHRQAAAMN